MLGTILYIDAFVSPFGTGLIYQTSTSRVGYGLARNRYYPQIFQRTSAAGVPWVSRSSHSSSAWCSCCRSRAGTRLVSLVTGASVLMYAGAPLALGAFRGQVPEARRAYRMPGAAVLGPIAFIIANLIIYWSGFETIWNSASHRDRVVLIGISMASLTRSARRWTGGPPSGSSPGRPGDHLPGRAGSWLAEDGFG